MKISGGLFKFPSEFLKYSSYRDRELQSFPLKGSISKRITFLAFLADVELRHKMIIFLVGLNTFVIIHNYITLTKSIFKNILYVINHSPLNFSIISERVLHSQLSPVIWNWVVREIFTCSINIIIFLHWLAYFLWLS